MNVKVEWETDGEAVDLPEIVTVPEDVEEDQVSDWLSDEFGWLVLGWVPHGDTKIQS